MVLVFGKPEPAFKHPKDCQCETCNSKREWLKAFGFKFAVEVTGRKFRDS